MTGAQDRAISERLDRVNRGVSGLHARLGRINERCNGCQSTLQAHDLALDGTNGEPGLKARVRIVELATADLARAQTRAYWFALGFFGTGAITLIGSILAALWK